MQNRQSEALTELNKVSIRKARLKNALAKKESSVERDLEKKKLELEILRKKIYETKELIKMNVQEILLKKRNWKEKKQKMIQKQRKKPENLCQSKEPSDENDDVDQG